MKEPISTNDNNNYYAVHYEVFDRFQAKSSFNHAVIHNWELPLTLIMISIGWWENYISGAWPLDEKINVTFKRWRNRFQVNDTIHALYFSGAKFATLLYVKTKTCYLHKSI